jgi:serine/threonine protein kinase
VAEDVPTLSERVPHAPAAVDDRDAPRSAPVASAASFGPAADAPLVPGYDLVRVLGRGGMGIVWEAIEQRFDRKVALKVHAVSGKKEDEDLWSEALVAAKIGDPGIVRVLDVGFTLDMRPYYAMELAEGTDLAALLEDGPLAPRQAVAIAADVARAVAAAHEHGVVHRDLKPRNVMVDSTGRARVLDFGVALVVHAKDRFEGMLAGSPAYMAPEQVLGTAVGPQTDIFALGVILHEMLTGKRPFTAATTEALLGAIAVDEPEPPSTTNPQVDADLDAVVARCLAKERAQRFPTARALFETLQAIAEGRRVDALPSPTAKRHAPKPSSVPPPDRPRREDAKKELAWTVRLRSSPAALWPWVANTDRFNKALGLAPVLFADETTPDGYVERTGELRVLGMPLRWREFPFEWVKDREFSVFRWYQKGPLEALWNHVTFTPLEDGGTELRHEIALSPRGVIGQVAAFLEIERRLGPAAQRFYEHLDAVLVAGGHVDPYEPAHAPSPEQRRAVDEACARLHAEGFEAKVVEKLAMHLLTAPDGALGTLRPYELADAWGVDRGALLDALVHAAHAGIVEPAWDVVCPRCLVAHETEAALAKVTRRGTCRSCATSFERDLRDSVELVFVPHPSVRRASRATYCAGAPALRPHVFAQQLLAPGERDRRVTVDLSRGEYRVAASANAAPWELTASALGFEDTVEVSIDGGRITGRPSTCRAGPVTFVFANDGDHEETVRVEEPGARVDAVSAAAALTHPSFHELFSDQLLARGEHMRVSRLAFLWVELRSRQELFARVGDAEACAEVSRLDALVRAEARAEEGTVVPSSLDRFVVAFATSLRAIRAALALRRALAGEGFAAIGPATAIAAHDGRCIALTRDGKSEFFGETLLRGAALLPDCPPRGIALSASFAADRTVALAVHESGMRLEVSTSAAAPDAPDAYGRRRVALLVPS